MRKTFPRKTATRIHQLRQTLGRKTFAVKPKPSRHGATETVPTPTGRTRFPPTRKRHASQPTYPNTITRYMTATTDRATTRNPSSEKRRPKPASHPPSPHQNPIHPKITRHCPTAKKGDDKITYTDHTRTASIPSFFGGQENRYRNFPQRFPIGQRNTYRKRKDIPIHTDRRHDLKHYPAFPTSRRNGHPGKTRRPTKAVRLPRTKKDHTIP